MINESESREICAKHLFPEFKSDKEFKISMIIFGGLIDVKTLKRVNICLFGTDVRMHTNTQSFCEALGMPKDETLYCVLKYGETLPTNYYGDDYE